MRLFTVVDYQRPWPDVVLQPSDESLCRWFSVSYVRKESMCPVSRSDNAELVAGQTSHFLAVLLFQIFRHHGKVCLVYVRFSF